MRLCVANFLIFIRWFVHWRNQTLCDSIEMSMNIFGRIFAHRHRPSLFLSFSVPFDCWWYAQIHSTQRKNKTIWIEADKPGEKSFAQGHLSLPILAKFHLFNGCVSHIFLTSSLFICLQTRSVWSLYVRFALFFVFHSRGNLFWLLFLSFDYLLLTSLQPHFPLRTHK